MTRVEAAPISPVNAATMSAAALTATIPAMPSPVISGPTRRCDRASEKYFHIPIACQTVIIAAAGHAAGIGRMNEMPTIVHANAIGKTQKNVLGTVAGARNHTLARRMPAPNTSAAIAHVATAGRLANRQSTSIITLAATHAVTPASTYGRGRKT